MPLVHVLPTRNFGIGPTFDFRSDSSNEAMLTYNNHYVPDNTSSESGVCSDNDTDSQCSELDTKCNIDLSERETNVQKNTPIRRGRPKSDLITTLILNGITSNSNIKCNVCNRVFPRYKSLQAHMRTHTGERPYKCNFHLCTKSFRQSGQLKTHQRLHTGEKPFACPADGCNVRHKHPNRRCQFHPDLSLLRDDEGAVDENIENEDEATVAWRERYYQERNKKKCHTAEKRKRPQGESANKKMHLKCIETDASVTDESRESVPETNSVLAPETNSVLAPETNSVLAPETNSVLVQETKSVLVRETKSVLVRETRLVSEKVAAACVGLFMLRYPEYKQINWDTLSIL